MTMCTTTRQGLCSKTESCSRPVIPFGTLYLHLHSEEEGEGEGEEEGEDHEESDVDDDVRNDQTRALLRN